MSRLRSSYRPDIYHIDGEDVLLLTPTSRETRFIQAVADKLMFKKLGSATPQTVRLQRGEFFHLDGLLQDQYEKADMLNQLVIFGLVQPHTSRTYFGLWEEVGLSLTDKALEVLNFFREGYWQVKVSEDSTTCAPVPIDG